MHNVSEVYRRIIRGEYWTENVLEIGGAEEINLRSDAGMMAAEGRVYGEADTLKEMTAALAAFAGDTPSVGACVARVLKVTIKTPQEEIPRNARLVPWTRVCNESEKSEWIPKGVYYIDTREHAGSILKLVGYDSILRMEEMYPNSGQPWPVGGKLIADAVAEMTEALGIEVEPETTAMLESKTIKIPNAYDYTCRETMGFIAAMCAGNATTSDRGKLQIIQLNALPEAPPPDIRTEPQDVWAYPQKKVQFRVEAVGLGLQYRWQYRSSDDGNWVNTSVDGANTDTVRPDTTLSRNGRQYRCRITDRNGNTVYTKLATLHVRPFIEIVQQPEAQTVRRGENAVFMVTARGFGLSYAWQASIGGKWQDVGQNEKNVIIRTTAELDGTQIRCRVEDADGHSEITETVTLAVLPPLIQILRQPEGQTVSIGQAAAFHVEATGDDLRYQWQYRSAGASGWVNCSAATEGYNAATLRPVGSSQRNGYQYRCRISDSHGETAVSETAMLTVLAAFGEGVGFIE